MRPSAEKGIRHFERLALNGGWVPAPLPTTPELDEGPIIELDGLRVGHRDTVQNLIRKGRELEVLVLARVIRLHVEHRVSVYGRKTVVFD